MPDTVDLGAAGARAVSQPATLCAREQRGLGDARELRGRERQPWEEGVESIY